MEAVALPASKNGLTEAGVLHMPVMVNEFKKQKKEKKNPGQARRAHLGLQHCRRWIRSIHRRTDPARR
jgi:hypothetical protein